MFQEKLHRSDVTLSLLGWEGFGTNCHLGRLVLDDRNLGIGL